MSAFGSLNALIFDLSNDLDHPPAPGWQLDRLKEREFRLCLIFLVVASGFEPPTPTMSRWCSNQLSYATVNSGSRLYGIALI